MGNSSSAHHHEPLDHGGFTRGTYGDAINTKSASFRQSKKSPRKMDRLRRSFRDSFRRRKDRLPESSKPHQWQSDEQAVRSATCSFPVKYLGCVEVYESRGMQVCEEALKVLRNSRRRPVRGLLHVSGDGLRVVDDETKGLIVDQTIEKVSFCAPDRNHERGFSYICRDGTTRRWMCHGFLASKDSGERLSHAVGCAFAVCLERKQRRDKECGVTMTFDMKNSTFTRSGSFRQQTMTERLLNNERCVDGIAPSMAVPPQPKPFNPFAIERPHATASMLERQGSFRGLGTLGSTSPFKRQMSLRLNDLPSNAERQKAFLDLATPKGTLRSVSPIPEVSPQIQENQVSQLCQEMSQELSLMTTKGDEIQFSKMELLNSAPTSPVSNFNLERTLHLQMYTGPAAINGTSSSILTQSSSTVISNNNNVDSMANNNLLGNSTISSPLDTNSINSIKGMSPISQQQQQRTNGLITTTGTIMTTQLSPQRSQQRVLPMEGATPLPNPEQWLGQVVQNTSPKRPPSLNVNSRTKSLNAGDPFDAEWVDPIVKTDAQGHNTNPFISPPKPPAQSFQVQL